VKNDFLQTLSETRHDHEWACVSHQLCATLPKPLEVDDAATDRQQNSYFLPFNLSETDFLYKNLNIWIKQYTYNRSQPFFFGRGTEVVKTWYIMGVPIAG